MSSSQHRELEGDKAASGHFGRQETFKFEGRVPCMSLFKRRWPKMIKFSKIINICSVIAQHCQEKTLPSLCRLHCTQRANQCFKSITFSHLMTSPTSEFVFIKSKLHFVSIPDVLLVLLKNSIILSVPLTSKNNLKNICSPAAFVLTLRYLISIPKSAETLWGDVL